VTTYWYSGRIYGTEIARDLDVLELAPSPGVAAELRARAGRLAGAAEGARQAKLARVMGAIALKPS
jgi:hypothetical protein